MNKRKWYVYFAKIKYSAFLMCMNFQCDRYLQLISMALNSIECIKSALSMNENISFSDAMTKWVSHVFVRFSMARKLKKKTLKKKNGLKRINTICELNAFDVFKYILQFHGNNVDHFYEMNSFIETGELAIWYIWKHCYRIM